MTWLVPEGGPPQRGPGTLRRGLQDTHTYTRHTLSTLSLSCIPDGFTHSSPSRAFVNPVQFPIPSASALALVGILSYNAFRTALRVYQGLLGLRCPRPLRHLWSRPGLAWRPVHPETASTCDFDHTWGLEEPRLLALNRIVGACTGANADTGLYMLIDSTPSGGTTSTDPRGGALRVSRRRRRRVLSVPGPTRPETVLTCIFREPSHPLHPASPGRPGPLLLAHIASFRLHAERR